MTEVCKGERVDAEPALDRRVRSAIGRATRHRTLLADDMPADFLTAAGAAGAPLAQPVDPAHPLRLAFFGTPAEALPAFNHLVQRFDVVLAVTQPERGRGAGRDRPIANAAAGAGIEVVTPLRARDALSAIGRSGADVAAVVAYGQILPQAVLDAFLHGMVNLHFSLLPRWRGAAPVERAILAGDVVTGVSTMVLDAGMDTGPVLDSIEVRIHADERTGELVARLADIGAPLLCTSIAGWVDGSKVAARQDASRATTASKVTSAEARVDWSQPADEIVRTVRGFWPRPGAWTSEHPSGARWKIARARVGDSHDGAVPGTIRFKPLRIAAADCWVTIVEAQPEGRRVIPGDAIANGLRGRADVCFG